MSLLRNLLIEMNAEALPTGALEAACMLIARSGLQAFAQDEEPTLAEVEALAHARELLVKEHIILFLVYSRKPERALRQFDGGRAERDKLMSEVWQAVGLD